jgi:hypothetical protein
MNELIYESIPLNLLIEKYEPHQFEFGGYTFSDKYIPPKEKQKYGSYILKIATGEMTELRQLNGCSVKLSQMSELVTMLFKYITGTSIFFDQDGIDLRRKRVLLAGECPAGWSSNFEELCASFSTGPIFIGVPHLLLKPNVQMLLSPLYELHIMLLQYWKLDATTQYLMRLNYEADLASNIIRGMAYGKVLEIINAIHPMPKGRGKKDTRIEEFYGEIKELFKGKTIKKLMDLANNRADTRHYVAHNKDNVEPHPFMNYDELGEYGPLIDMLAINEVRMSFGLPIMLSQTE